MRSVGRAITRKVDPFADGRERRQYERVRVGYLAEGDGIWGIGIKTIVQKIREKTTQFKVTFTGGSIVSENTLGRLFQWAKSVNRYRAKIAIIDLDKKDYQYLEQILNDLKNDLRSKMGGGNSRSMGLAGEHDSGDRSPPSPPEGFVRFHVYEAYTSQEHYLLHTRKEYVRTWEEFKREHPEEVQHYIQRGYTTPNIPEVPVDEATMRPKWNARVKGSWGDPDGSAEAFSTIDVSAAQEAEALDILKRIHQQSRMDTNTLVYDLIRVAPQAPAQPPAGQTRFVVFESYKRFESFTTHKERSYIRLWREFRLEHPEVRMYLTKLTGIPNTGQERDYGLVNVADVSLESEERFLDVMGRIGIETRKEKGNLAFELIKVVKDSKVNDFMDSQQTRWPWTPPAGFERWLVVELYESGKAIDAHFHSPHMQQWKLFRGGQTLRGGEQYDPLQNEAWMQTHITPGLRIVPKLEGGYNSKDNGRSGWFGLGSFR